jgi:hypothetical protein
MRTFLQGFLGGVCAVLLLGAATLSRWGPSLLVSDTLYVGRDNAVEVSQPTTDTLKIVVDPDNAQGGYKKIEFYSGDHATNPAWTFQIDGDNHLAYGYTNAGSQIIAITSSATSSGFGRSTTGARSHWYNSGHIAEILPSTNGTDYWLIYDSTLAQLCSMDSAGTFTLNGSFIMPYSTAASNATTGSMFLDTDASANGSLYVYSNGSWRKVADLP